MDGTETSVVHTFDYAIVDIALDLDTQTLYWATYDYYTIESSNVDGSNIRILASQIFTIRSMDFFSGNLYYITLFHSDISVSIMKPNGTLIYTNSISDCGDIGDIKVVSEQRQTQSKVVYNV